MATTRYARPFLVLLLLAVWSAGCNPVPQLSPTEAQGLVEDDLAVLVDVRELSELDEGMAEEAIWLPTSRLEAEPDALDRFLAQIPGEKQVLLYCRSGQRADTVGREIVRKGWKAGNVGGYRDWVDAGLPTKPRPQRMFPLAFP